MKRMITSFLAFVMVFLMLGSMSRQASAEGQAPIAENLDLKTFRNTSVGGRLNAFDPDNDILSFTVTTHPRKGEIRLEEDGTFLYVPGEGSKGRDYFGYKAIDGEGNLSQEATVIIRIEKQKSEVSYTDMKENPHAYAAAVLAEEQIFIGRRLGGSYHFQPEEGVSRGEFIHMCMALLDVPILSGELPLWEQPLTTGEAADILNASLRLNDVSYISLEQSLSDRQAQACANLEACGILRQGRPLLENITRSEAAEMLCQALLLIRQR